MASRRALAPLLLVTFAPHPGPKIILRTLRLVSGFAPLNRRTCGAPDQLAPVPLPCSNTRRTRSTRSISNVFMHFTPTPMQTFGIFTLRVELAGTSRVTTAWPWAKA